MIRKIIFCLILSCGCLAMPLPLADAFVYQDRIATSKSLSHYAMAYIHDLWGETNLAVLEYEKAVQYDENGYLIHLRLGADYARLDMLSQAVSELLIVNKHNPEDLQAHYLLALIYSTQKNYDKAAEEYEFILKSFSAADPQNIEIYGYLGQLYYSQKKYTQAIAQFEKIMAIEPENADIMYLLGSLYLEVDQREKAISVLQKSIAIDPEHDGSLNTLGYIYADSADNLDEAKELISRALAISPNNGAYLDSLGWVYFKKGDYKLALETLLKADEVLKDPVIYDHIGDACYKLNRFEDAVKYWNKSLELQPGQNDIIKKIADINSDSAQKSN